MRRFAPFWVTLLLVGVVGCGQSPSSAAHASKRSPHSPQSTQSVQSVQSGSQPATPAEQPKVDPSPAEPAQSSDSGEVFGGLAEALGLGTRGRRIPDGLLPGGECPVIGPDADEEIAAQAAARVPLKVGLTLTNLWIPNAQEEYECLNQVVTVDRAGYVFTVGCTNPRTPGVERRRVCRSDLRAARMLHTQVGGMTIIDASGDELPESVVGATEFSLSVAEFAELKRTGTTRHHYVQLASMDGIAVEATAVLRREAAETAPVTVNDRTIDVPVIRASGEANLWMHGREAKGRVTALILDDERFPLLVDYKHTTETSDVPHFRLYFPKVSFPSSRPRDEEGVGSAQLGGREGGKGEMERRLSEERRVDVYGIYFDFNSARIRDESEPILQEITDMLSRNPDWTLSIGGHTDNVGGAAYNLDLSDRRAAAVKQALVTRFKIGPERLQTAGYGLSAPKDTNETPEGRARNRRVELVRR